MPRTSGPGSGGVADAEADREATRVFVVARFSHGIDLDVAIGGSALSTGADQVSAMHAAILAAPDRHVDSRNLGIPLPSSVVGADPTL